MGTLLHNERVVLVRRPRGRIDEHCFALDRRPVPAPRHGDVVVRNIFVSCDPYLRLRMDEDFPLGEPVTARAVGEVVASADPALAEGDVVWGFLGWERYSVAPASRLTPVDRRLGPLSHAISVRGMIGLTAWVGMLDIGRPQPGDTVVVSSAAGAVGSVAGQLARLAGARVVGIAGGEHKVRHLREHLGFASAVDYKGRTPLRQALADACPDGIDVYFDNVGGDVLDAVLDHLRPCARLAMCGVMSQYDGGGPALTDLAKLLGRRPTMTWFTIYDHLHELTAFVPRMAKLVAEGSVVYHEDITEGIENVPTAFLGLFRGDNLGKCLVRVGDDPG